MVKTAIFLVATVLWTIKCSAGATLSCYKCSYSQNNCTLDSVKDVEKTTCTGRDVFCRVTKITDLEGNLQEFRRGCDTQCSNKHVEWTAGSLKKCISCCSEANCNTDACGSAALRASALVQVLAFVLFTLSGYGVMFV